MKKRTSPNLLRYANLDNEAPKRMRLITRNNFTSPKKNLGKVTFESSPSADISKFVLKRGFVISNFDVKLPHAEHSPAKRLLFK